MGTIGYPRVRYPYVALLFRRQGVARCLVSRALSVARGRLAGTMRLFAFEQTIPAQPYSTRRLVSLLRPRRARQPMSWKWQVESAAQQRAAADTAGCAVIEGGSILASRSVALALVVSARGAAER